MPEALAKRLLVVGWDAADWILIDRLFEVGGMPNLRRLVEGGVRADLNTLEPRLSPILWTSIATGKTADKHGILNFVEPDPLTGSLRLAASTSRRCKALWNILHECGKRVTVVGWYASHPAEPIRGTCVSNLFCEGASLESGTPWPLPAGSVHPPERARTIDLRRVSPAAALRETVPQLIPHLERIPQTDARPGTLARLLAHALSVQGAALSILKQDRAAGTPADCTLVFLDAIDTIGHHFMRCVPPVLPGVPPNEIALYGGVMSEVYKLHDAMLGALIDAAGPETTVVLLSDHGFYSDHRRPPALEVAAEERAELEAAWHRQQGILAMHGPGIAQGRRIHGAGLLDIAPTLLALLGIAPGADMDGRVLGEAFDRPISIDPLPSWESTEADAGRHPPEMRQDPAEAREAIRQLVDLGYLAALPDDAKGQLELVDRETRFNLATVYATTGRPAEALPIYRALVEQRPAEPRYALALAQAQMRSHDFEGAIATLQAHLEHAPASTSARLLLGAAFAAIGRSGEATQTYEALEAEHGESDELSLALGDLAWALQRFDAAGGHYERAKAFDPNNPAVHLGLARTALVAEAFEQSAEHCLDAIEIQHVLPEAHHLLGVALTWAGAFDHAVQSFEIALSMAPGSIDSHRYLAAIHRHQGDHERARTHHEEVERLLAENAVGQNDPSVHRREAPMGPAEWARRVGVEE